MGFFEKRSGDVIWLGVEEENVALRGLYESLCHLLYGVNGPPYVPHITLARNAVWANSDDKSCLQKQIQASLKKRPLFLAVEAIHLMRTHRVNEELVYTSIQRQSSRQ